MTDSSVAGVVRAAATAAALVLAALSRGDALVLGVLLVVAAWRLTALAVLPALVAVSWRWGSTSLDAWAGAQAVLGPAGVVGPARAAAACWLAATAVVLATPTGDVTGKGARWGHTGAPNLGAWATAVTTGSASAAVVAGPALGGAVWARVLAAAAGTLLAVAVSWARARRPFLRRVGDVLGVVTGLGAVVLASVDAPAWSGTVDGDALVAGALVAAAVVALVLVASQAVGALRLNRG